MNRDNIRYRITPSANRDGVDIRAEITFTMTMKVPAKEYLRKGQTPDELIQFNQWIQAKCANMLENHIREQVAQRTPS